MYPLCTDDWKPHLCKQCLTARDVSETQLTDLRVSFDMVAYMTYQTLWLAMMTFGSDHTKSQCHRYHITSADFIFQLSYHIEVECETAFQISQVLSK